MSEKGEKTCPLCAEEMDLTDQQLKPCKCGYEICVWCWHHVMDMAERDGTEGRCPACRTPYDKEKIVATAEKCERMVAEIFTERKLKTQKNKPKSSEGRMHLTNIRVVQRNLVYIIGLPLNLADEELLQKKEYFGKYGKVLKVSISRTASGAIQHSSNNSCCVYITYSKEDEATRCIQSVHSFILEGKPLRACFGTTKYCHAWLRNMPCTIADCLYLHDFGPEEDSFSKDDIVSAFTRSKVQQVIGASNNVNGRSGNTLPSPADVHADENLSSSVNGVASNSNNNIGNQNNGNMNNVSYADSGIGRSNGLPASGSWVMRVSASLPAKNCSGSDRVPSDQLKISSGTQVLKSEVVRTTRFTNNMKSMKSIANHEVHLNSTSDALELAKGCVEGECSNNLSNTDNTIDTSATTKSRNISSHLPSPKGSDKDISVLPSSTAYSELIKPLADSSYDDDDDDDNDNDTNAGEDQDLCSRLSSIGLQTEHSFSVPKNSTSNCGSASLDKSQGSQDDISELYSEPTSSSSLRETANEIESNYQNLNGSEGMGQLPSVSSVGSLQNLNKSSHHSWQLGEVKDRSNLDLSTKFGLAKQNEVASSWSHQNSESKHNNVALPLFHTNFSSDKFNNDRVRSFGDWDATFNSASTISEMGLRNYIGKYDNYSDPSHDTVASDMGESNIISKILSIDSDVWEDSLTSPQSLVRLLNQNDNQDGSLRFSSLLKEPDGRQSRFSFARQEDTSNRTSYYEHSLGNIGHATGKWSSQNNMTTQANCMGRNEMIFSASQPVETDNFHGIHMPVSSPVSKPTSSAPPGFAVPSRAPPPGFSTHGMIYKQPDSPANLLQESSQQTVQHLLRTSSSAARTVGRYEDEFADPAILEVGNGVNALIKNNQGVDTRQNFSRQLNPVDHEIKLQLLMRQSLSGYQDSLTSTIAPQSDPYSSSPNNGYGMSSMLLHQPQPSIPSSYAPSAAPQFRNYHASNGHLGNWNEVKSINDRGMADLMTNGGLGYSKFAPGFEDLKCQMSNSNNLYNRGFAM